MAFIYQQDRNIGELLACDASVGKAINVAAREITKNVKNGGNLPGSARLASRRKSIRTWLSRVRKVDGERTHAAMVANYDNLAVVYEFGSINSPPYRPLTRAVMASGLRYDATPAPGDYDIQRDSGEQAPQ
jgi:hypothetical protein